MNGDSLNVELIMKEGEMIKMLRDYKESGGTMERITDILKGVYGKEEEKRTYKDATLKDITLIRVVDDSSSLEEEEEESEDPRSIIYCPDEDCQCGGYDISDTLFHCPRCQVNFTKTCDFKGLPDCNLCNEPATVVRRDTTRVNDVEWKTVHISGVPSGLKVGAGRQKTYSNTLLGLIKTRIGDHLKEKFGEDTPVPELYFPFQRGTENKGGKTWGGYCTITFSKHSMINEDTMIKIREILAEEFTRASEEEDYTCDFNKLVWNFQRKKKQVNGKRKK